MKRLLLFVVLAVVAVIAFQQAGYLSIIYFGEPLLTASLSAALLLFGLFYRNARIRSILAPIVDGTAWGRLVPVAAAMALLLLFPTRRMEEPPVGPGDGFHLTEFIPVFAEIYGYLTTPDELLALFVRSKLYLLLKNVTDAQSAIGAYSYLAGIIHIIAVFVFLRNRHDWKAGWLILFFTPAMALYAGYVESYSMTRALLFVTIVIGWTVLSRPEGKRSDGMVMIAAVVAALAALHHLLAGLILPALIYMVWKIADGKVKGFFLRSIPAGMIAVAILGAVFGSFYLSSMSSMVFSDSHVGMDGLLSVGKLFSKGNLLKMTGLLLMAPTFLIIVLSSARREVENDMDSTIRRFLWMATAPFLLHAFLWNAAIGLPADWDLFTFFAIPLSLLVFHSWQRLQSQSTIKILVLPLLTLLPAILWLHWLHDESPNTQENRQYIAHVRSSVLPGLKGDERLAGLPLKRQKMYLRLRLFEEKAHYRMAKLPLSADRQEAEQALEQGMQTFYSGLKETDSVYEQRIVEAQSPLFAVHKFLQQQNEQ